MLRISNRKYRLDIAILILGILSFRNAFAIDANCPEQELARVLNELKNIRPNGTDGMSRPDSTRALSLRAIDPLPEDFGFFLFLNPQATREEVRLNMRSTLIQDLRDSVARLLEEPQSRERHRVVALSVYNFLRHAGVRVLAPRPTPSKFRENAYEVHVDLESYRRDLAEGRLRFSELPRDVKIALSAGVQDLAYSTLDVEGGGASVHFARGTDIKLYAPTSAPELARHLDDLGFTGLARVIRIVATGPMTSLTTHEIGHVKVMKGAIAAERLANLEVGSVYIFDTPPAPDHPPGRYTYGGGFVFRRANGDPVTVSRTRLESGLGVNIHPVINGVPVRLHSELSQATFLPFHSPRALEAIRRDMVLRPVIGYEFEISLSNSSDRIRVLTTGVDQDHIELQSADGSHRRLTLVEFAAGNPRGVTPDFGQGILPFMEFRSQSGGAPLVENTGYGNYFALDEVAQYSRNVRSANQQLHRFLIELQSMERQRARGQGPSEAQMRSTLARCLQARALLIQFRTQARQILSASISLLKLAIRNVAQNPDSVRSQDLHGLEGLEVDLAHGQTARFARSQAAGVTPLVFLSRTLELVRQYAYALGVELTYDITIPARVNVPGLPDTPARQEARNWPNEFDRIYENERLLQEFLRRHPEWRPVQTHSGPLSSGP